MKLKWVTGFLVVVTVVVSSALVLVTFAQADDPDGNVPRKTEARRPSPTDKPGDSKDSGNDVASEVFELIDVTYDEKVGLVFFGRPKVEGTNQTPGRRLIEVLSEESVLAEGELPVAPVEDPQVPDNVTGEVFELIDVIYDEQGELIFIAGEKVQDSAEATWPRRIEVIPDEPGVLDGELSGTEIDQPVSAGGGEVAVPAKDDGVVAAVSKCKRVYDCPQGVFPPDPRCTATCQRGSTCTAVCGLLCVDDGEGGQRCSCECVRIL